MHLAILTFLRKQSAEQMAVRWARYLHLRGYPLYLRVGSVCAEFQRAHNLRIYLAPPSLKQHEKPRFFIE